MCWTTYHFKLKCGVYAIVVALAFIADGATADNRGGVSSVMGCVNLHYTVFPSLLYIDGASHGMLPQRR
jgi:hypothetical protein